MFSILGSWCSSLVNLCKMMASIHEIRIPDDHKAVITEMMKKKKVAKMSFVTNVNREVEDFLTYTDGEMLNRVESDLTLLNSHNYSGKPIGSYPPIIESNQTHGFSHRADITTDPKGSKGVVVYSGYNTDDASKEECAWLLAWHTPIGGSDCKVYVECGPVAPYKSTTLRLDIIQQKLDKSSSKSYFKDQKTGAESSAQIEVFGGNTADLAAFFKVSN